MIAEKICSSLYFNQSAVPEYCSLATDGFSRRYPVGGLYNFFYLSMQISHFSAQVALLLHSGKVKYAAGKILFSLIKTTKHLMQGIGLRRKTQSRQQQHHGFSGAPAVGRLITSEHIAGRPSGA